MNMLFILFAALLLLSCASAKPVIVSLAGRSVQLRGEVADFGYQFDQAVNHPSDLMLAPVEDPYLCSYPPSLENAPPRNASSPITLLVSRAKCPFETKAKVALALQQNFSGGIQYVIIYNNDPNSLSQVIRMGAEGLDVPTLGFVAISTRAGSYTLSSVLYYADTTDQSPYLSTNETEWSYPIDIENFHSYSRGGAGSGSNTSYVLHFVLFALLIWLHVFVQCICGITVVAVLRFEETHVAASQVCSISDPHLTGLLRRHMDKVGKKGHVC